jgi:hypothetical protein
MYRRRYLCVHSFEKTYRYFNTLSSLILKVFVVGIRLSVDSNESKEESEEKELPHHGGGVLSCGGGVVVVHEMCNGLFRSPHILSRAFILVLITVYEYTF